MPSRPSSTRRRSPRRSASGRPVIIVTGGSGGIGRAICIAFARAGWRIGVHYHTGRREAERTLRLVGKSGGHGMLVEADIRDAKSVQHMVDEVCQHWKQLDGMVCNAGRATSGLLLAQRADEWRADIETNLSGTFHCMRAAATAMQSRCGGSIVVVGSYAAVQGQPGQSAYAASKAGLIGLIKSAAREWGVSGIRVNLVFPGWQRTRLAGDALPAEGTFSDHLTGQPPSLEQVAESVVHVARMTDTSGQVWNLDSRIF